MNTHEHNSVLKNDMFIKLIQHNVNVLVHNRDVFNNVSDILYSTLEYLDHLVE